VVLNFGSSHLLNPPPDPPEDMMANENYPTTEIRILTQLEHILMRPRMYFGDTPTASIELAAFINGYMVHRSGFMRGGFMDNECFGCKADPAKTLEENAIAYKAAIELWDKNKSGAWRCCVDAPKDPPK
jgi:hypothetical protein